MRQGNDAGTQYRSAIYTVTPEQMESALKSKNDYQKVRINLKCFQVTLQYSDWEKPLQLILSTYVYNWSWSRR